MQIRSFWMERRRSKVLLRMDCKLLIILVAMSGAMAVRRDERCE